MKNIIFFIGFILLFLLQETEQYNTLILALIVLLASLSLVKENLKISISLPSYFIFFVMIYIFFLIEGFFYHHNKPTIDIKFQVFGFLLFFVFLNIRNFNWLKLFFAINYTVFVIYLLLYLKLLPNFWHNDYLEFKGRVYGPPIFSFIIIAFIYIYENRKFDLKLGVAFVLSLIYILFTTNFMNLIIQLILFFLVFLDLKKIFSPKIIGLFLLVIIFSLVFLNSKYVPKLVEKKLYYVTRPWEYPSFKIRISDLKKAYKQEDYTTKEKLLGKGFGASTVIYRENKIAKSLSRYMRFQEIDNGFYYLFHRGGILLLLLFIVFHSLLLLLMPNYKAALAFFTIITITNLLSIHYFNYYFYFFLTYFIITSKYSRNIVFNTKNYKLQ